MNPLDQYPGARKVLYLIQWIVSGVMGVLGVILTAINGIDDLPQWYVIASLALSFIWTYTGITAQTNTPSAPEPVVPHDPNLRAEDGSVDIVVLLLVVITVLTFLIFLVEFHVITPGR